MSLLSSAFRDDDRTRNRNHSRKARRAAPGRLGASHPRPARAQVPAWVELLEVRISPAASKLHILTAPQTIAPGATSGTITVQLEDASGNAVVAGAGGLAVDLTTTSSGGTFVASANNPIAVTSVTVTNPGSGYIDSTGGLAPPTLSFSGGGGSGETATANLTSTGSVGGVNMMAHGSQIDNSTVTFAAPPPGGTTATGTADVIANQVRGVTMTNGGSGYPSAPLVTFVSDGHNEATGTAFLNQGVGSVTVTNGGSGFTAAPTVTFAAPNGPFGNVTATGTVHIGVYIPAGSSTASFFYRDTAPGTLTITASASGLTAATQQESIVIPTTTAVASSLNPSVYGQTVTFTATITNTAGVGGVPTGTVEFFDGSTDLGAGSAPSGSGSSATSTLALSTLAAGSHSISAVFTATGNSSGSTSPLLTQGVNQATLTVTADDVSRPYGTDNPTLTAHITGFQNNETLATSGVSGTPSLATAATAASPASNIPYTITAAAGTLTASNYTFTFASGALTVTPVQLTVVADPQSKVFGDADPALTYQLTVGSFVGGDGFSGSLTRVAGESVGSYAIQVGTLTASTNYAVNFVGANLAITPVPLNVALGSSNPGPTNYGVPITFTATVTNADSNSHIVPHVGVIFYANGPGGTQLGVVYPTGSVDTVSLTTAYVPMGTNSITAVTVNAPNFASAVTSAALTQVVNPVSVNVALGSSNPGPTNYGVPITFTATVTNADPNSQITPSLGVIFYAGGPSGTRLGVVYPTGGSNTVSLTTAYMPVGTNSITAVTVNAPGFISGTSTALTQVVNPVSVNVALGSSNPGPTNYGVPITFTATVTSADPNSQVTPSLGVIFYANGPSGTRLGVVYPTGGSNTVSLTTAYVPIGTNSITAVTVNAPSYIAGTSTALTQVVNSVSVNVALGSSNPGPTNYGVPITFTATVTSADPNSQVTPSLGVIFYANGPGGTRLGVVYPTGGSNTVSLTTAYVPIGTNSITAVTVNAPSYIAGTSTALTQVVNSVSVNVALGSSNPGPTNYGVPITFTATVTSADPNSQVTPSLGVIFYANGPSGTRLGVVYPTGGSNTVSLTTGYVPVGTNSITAVTVNAPGYIAGTSTALTQVVNPADTLLALTSSAPDGADAGTAVTFTAMVSNVEAGSDIPSGLVQFFDGTTLLGTGTLSGGKTTLTTSSLTLGSHTIKAVFLVNSKYASSSNMLTQAIS